MATPRKQITSPTRKCTSPRRTGTASRRRMNRETPSCSVMYRVRRGLIRIFAISILSLLIAIAIVVSGVSYFVIYEGLRPSQRDLDETYGYMYSDYPFLRPWMKDLDKRHAMRDTLIYSPDSVRLHAYIIPADKPTPNTAVVIHGHRCCAIDMLHIAYMYSHDMHFNVLLPELRAHGQSEGTHEQMGWLDRKDVLQWMNVANTMFGGILLFRFQVRLLVYALVIPGGGNVTPSEYGEERSEFTSDTDLEKDELQIAAVKRFVDVKKPVLGLCRGNQLINVAFGGTIDQGNGEYHEGWHKVIIAEGSLMYDTFGGEVDAYHYHKQQVKDLGKGLIATQWDADDPDLIEGFEHETLPVYGVQWHPDAIKMHEIGERAFEAFKNVVAENKGLTDTQ